MSGIGKGVAAGSIGASLSDRGYKVNIMKIDPYINVDAGTMHQQSTVKCLSLRVDLKQIKIWETMRDFFTETLICKTT